MPDEFEVMEEEPQTSQSLTSPTEGEDLPTIHGPDRSRRAEKRRAAPTATRAQAPEASVTDMSTGSLIQILAARTVDSELLKKQLLDMCGVKDFKYQERVSFGQWLSSCAGQVPEEKWTEFISECVDLMNRFVNRTTATATTSTAPSLTRSMSAPSHSDPSFTQLSNISQGHYAPQYYGSYQPQPGQSYQASGTNIAPTQQTFSAAQSAFSTQETFGQYSSTQSAGQSSRDQAGSFSPPPVNLSLSNVTPDCSAFSNVSSTYLESLAIINTPPPPSSNL